jgi:hypothetical protein
MDGDPPTFAILPPAPVPGPLLPLEEGGESCSQRAALPSTISAEQVSAILTVPRSSVCRAGWLREMSLSINQLDVIPQFGPLFAICLQAGSL